MQTITHLIDNSEVDVVIERVKEEDYKKMTKSRFYFNWKTEKGNEVYKLIIAGTDEILGLMSLIHVSGESRFEINLLAVLKENRGSGKVYEGIAGNLIAYACRESQKIYAEQAFVSLIPKTRLKIHYVKKYGMKEFGSHLVLAGTNLLMLVDKYDI